MNKDTIKSVWADFFAATDEPSKKPLEKQLVEYYYPLVRKVATKMHQKLSDSVTIDELVSNGVDGLYQTLNSFDRSRNIKFETYATPRIKGAILDAIRKEDWVPRLVRARTNWLNNKRQILEGTAGHKLSDNELAEKLGFTMEQFMKFSKSAIGLHSMSDKSDDDEQYGLADSIKDDESSQPVENILRQEFFNKLLGRNFTPHERKIMWLYYYEQLSMREISEQVDLSESRVSQMHNMILKRLRQKQERNPEYFKEITRMLGEFKNKSFAI